MVSTNEGLKKEVLETAKRFAEQGPGYAQQTVVLNEVAGRRSAMLDLNMQQAILTCWHDLFQEGLLSWGYNLSNPDPPFFHIPKRD